MMDTHKILLKDIKNLYSLIKDNISKRINEFEDFWKNSSDEDVFAELIFCILTPQSKALTCWNAVESLIKKDLLFCDDPKKIQNELIGVRFKYKKSEYIIEAKKHFFINGKCEMKKIIKGFDDIILLREWLVKNLKGYGYKEASHFLRNIGLGEKLAILDRHILRNLFRLQIIDKIPTSMTKKEYLDIERKMKVFSSGVQINLTHLDLLLWYKETYKIFK